MSVDLSRRIDPIHPTVCRPRGPLAFPGPDSLGLDAKRDAAILKRFGRQRISDREGGGVEVH